MANSRSLALRGMTGLGKGAPESPGPLRNQGQQRKANSERPTAKGQQRKANSRSLAMLGMTNSRRTRRHGARPGKPFGTQTARFGKRALHRKRHLAVSFASGHDSPVQGLLVRAIQGNGRRFPQTVSATLNLLLKLIHQFRNKQSREPPTPRKEQQLCQSKIRRSFSCYC
jgi:hypothetical protein